MTEAMDGEGQLYTKGRLKETLDRAGTPDAKAEQILAAVRADIAAHVGGAEQSDDVTMMAVRFLG
ncbi:MAG: SpoIIE family protein phosphatase [Schwartzia sp.]|nr:SpoIIE family protein phosphatase [Schwartzia sp. (in: firmicutes)]